MFLIPDHIKSIAHRGYSAKFKDNSLQSIFEAINLGFDFLELDIQLCKTKEIVLHHDLYLGDNLIENLSYQDIVSYDNSIITLDILFNCIDTNKVKIIFDIKGSIEINNYLVNKLNEYTINFNNVVLTSFNRNHIDMLSDKLFIKRGFITENIFSKDILIKIISNIQFLVINLNMLDNETINLCHSLGVKVFVYTVKNQQDLDHILKFNIDGIISNEYLNKSLI